MRPRQCTLNSRLREFHFKMLHGIAYTNHHLFRFKISQNNLCCYCKKEEETYRHLFFECEHARLVWNNCNNMFDCISTGNLSWEEIFGGIELEVEGKERLVNHVLISVKFSIFKGRERSSPITMDEIKRKFKEEEWEEKKLALEKGKISLHLRKWENLNQRNCIGRAR